MYNIKKCTTKMYNIINKNYIVIIASQLEDIKNNKKTLLFVIIVMIQPFLKFHCWTRVFPQCEREIMVIRMFSENIMNNYYVKILKY